MTNLRRKILNVVIVIALITVVTVMIVRAVHAQTPSPVDDTYIPPVETNDPYETSWRYERGRIDERVYREESSRLIRFRSISPTDGRVLEDRPATLEEIAAYSLTEQRTRSNEQTRISKSELQVTVDGTNLFPDWLLIQAQNAQSQGRVEDVILFMMLYHYIMADNPELFLAQ